jgi:cell division protease FtsH
MTSQIATHQAVPVSAPEKQATLHAHIAERSAQLEQLAAELKAELFGIDDVIDRVIESLRAWYVLPDLINRPVIICLWGLTGTGKTQLTRSIARKLGFYDRFVDVQMGGWSN